MRDRPRGLIRDMRSLWVEQELTNDEAVEVMALVVTVTDAGPNSAEGT